MFIRHPFANGGEHRLCRFACIGQRDYYIHIGVGSNVVCSTEIGNARASTRGTDNSDDSTLFYVQSPQIEASIKKSFYDSSL